MDRRIKIYKGDDLCVCPERWVELRSQKQKIKRYPIEGNEGTEGITFKTETFSAFKTQ